MSVYPDRRWLTKQYLVLGTITAVLVLSAAGIHLLFALFGQDADMGLVAAVTWGATAGTVLLMWAIAVPAVILWFRSLEYVVGDDKVTIHKGVLTEVQQDIPLPMVTDFRLHRSPYDRVLGLGSIQIQTAGQGATGTGYEGKLAGLADWATLHDDLRLRIRRVAAPVEPVVHSEDVQVLILEEMRDIKRVLQSVR